MSKSPAILEASPLTEDENQRLEAMREAHRDRIAQHNVHYLTMLRFLRGYKDDAKPLERSIDMLGKMLTWREEAKVDEIVAAVLPREEEFKKIWPSGVHGFGKEGNLIYVDRVGQVDPSKLMGKKDGFAMEDVQKFHIQAMEGVNRMKEQQYAATGNVKYKNLVILDLDGMGMSHLGSKFTAPMKSFIKIDQEYYPESLYQMVVMNAGWVVKSLWVIISPFIDPITSQRIKFAKKHEDLAEFIDVEQIPQFLGGRCKCKDGKCLESPFVAGYDPPRDAPKAAAEAAAAGAAAAAAGMVLPVPGAGLASRPSVSANGPPAGVAAAGRPSVSANAAPVQRKSVSSNVAPAAAAPAAASEVPVAQLAALELAPVAAAAPAAAASSAPAAAQ